MIGHPNLYCLVAGMTALVISLTGCKQTGALQSSSRPQESSWLSKLPFSTPNDARLAPIAAGQKADVQMAMARSFEKQGQIDQAIKIYHSIVRQDGRRADAYHRLAVLHDRKGDCKTSEELYRVALDREPHNAEVHCDLGYSYYLQRRWREAESSLRQAIAIRPDLARAHINLGLLLARTGRGDESLMEFARAGCPEADARANLAFALMLEERWMEAQSQYELALAIDPQSRAAQEGLATLQSLHPRFEYQRAVFANHNAGPMISDTGSRTPFLNRMENGGQIARRPEADASQRSLWK